MFKKIIIATDLSASSDAIVNCLNDFKSLGIEEVILFYACGIKYLDSMADGIKAEVEPFLKERQKSIEEQGYKASIEIASGIPAEELKTLADKKNVSLIVIGSHGSNGLFYKLLGIGNVTSEILHSHEKPLLMVRTKVIEINGMEKVEILNKSFKDRILFATDFSDISMRAFEYVVRLVEDGCKKVTLLHVQDKVKIEKHLSHRLEEFNRIDTERLEMKKQLLLSKGATDVEIKISYGIPSKEIIDESKKGYSLIIMGSQGKGFFKEIFIGSVSHNVARYADVSLLLIPSISR